MNVILPEQEELEDFGDDKKNSLEWIELLTIAGNFTHIDINSLKYVPIHRAMDSSRRVCPLRFYLLPYLRGLLLHRYIN